MPEKYPDTISFVSTVPYTLKPAIPFISATGWSTLFEWFKREWAKISSPKDQNILLNSIVKKIYYDRNGDTITLDIEYV